MSKSMKRRSLALLLAVALFGAPASSFALNTLDPDNGSPGPVDRSDSSPGADTGAPGPAGGGTDIYDGDDSDPHATVNDCGMTDPCSTNR